MCQNTQGEFVCPACGENATHHAKRNEQLAAPTTPHQWTVAEWSERTGIPHATLIGRINSGWCPERVVREPSTHHRSNGRLIPCVSQ